MPRTRFFGKPDSRSATWHIASSGFETTMMIAFWEYLTHSFVTLRTMSAFVRNPVFVLLGLLLASAVVIGLLAWRLLTLDAPPHRAPAPRPAAGSE